MKQEETKEQKQEKLNNKYKNKKEKVVYYDDGSTIADMSCLPNAKKQPQNKNTNMRYRASEKEKLKTFFAAFKMMLGPCIVVLTILAILYMILTLLVGFN